MIATTKSAFNFSISASDSDLIFVISAEALASASDFALAIASLMDWRAFDVSAAAFASILVIDWRGRGGGGGRFG